MSNPNFFILHLSLIEKVGPSPIQRIIDRIPDICPDEWYRFKDADFMRLGISQLAASRIVQGLQNKKLLDQELDQKVVCANFAQTTSHGAIKGKAQTNNLEHYNLY